MKFILVITAVAGLAFGQSELKTRTSSAAARFTVITETWLEDSAALNRQMEAAAAAVDAAWMAETQERYAVRRKRVETEWAEHMQAVRRLVDRLLRELPLDFVPPDPPLSDQYRGVDNMRDWAAYLYGLALAF